MRGLRILPLVALVVFLPVRSASAGTLTVEAKLSPDRLPGHEEAHGGEGPKGVSGTVVMDIDTDTNEICYKLTFKGLKEKITEAHVHDTYQGSEDSSKVIVFDVSKPEASKGMAGCLKNVVGAFIASNAPRHSVEIHTASYKNGAMRGLLQYSGDPGKFSSEVRARMDAQSASTPAAPDVVAAASQAAALMPMRETPQPLAATQPTPAPAIARTGTDLTGFLSLVGLSLLGLGTAARLAARRRP